MELNLTTVGILFAVLIVGYLIGLLEAFLKNSRKRRADQKTGEDMPSPDGEVEVIRAWRTGAGNLRLEMDGQKIENGKNIQPEQRRRLVNLLLDLRPWLETGSVTPGTTVRERPASRSSKPASEKADAGKPIAEPTSIVEQVDEILQARLEGTPLAAQGVRLQETPGGGVAIFVGLNKYDGIEEVPDKGIQAAIRQAIAEWERNR